MLKVINELASETKAHYDKLYFSFASFQVMLISPPSSVPLISHELFPRCGYQYMKVYHEW